MLVSVSGADFASSGTSVTVPVPANAAAGHRAIVSIFLSLDKTITPPSGQSWAENTAPAALSRGRVRWFHKSVTTADITAGSWVFTWSGSAENFAMASLHSGRDTSGTPFDFINSQSANANQMPAFGGTVATAGADIVIHSMDFQGSATITCVDGAAVAYTAHGNPDVGNNANSGRIFTRDNVSPAGITAQTSSVSSDSWWNLIAAIKPAAGGTAATGSASIALAAAGVAAARVSGSAAFVVTAAGTARASIGGTAAFGLAAAGPAIGQAAGAAQLSIAAAGSAAAPATGSAVLNVTADGSAPAITGSAALGLAATGAAPAVLGSAALELSAAGAGDSTAGATGAAGIELAAVGSVGGFVDASAAFGLTAAGTGAAVAAGAAVIALAAAGAAQTSLTGSAVLLLAAIGQALGRASGSAQLALVAAGSGHGPATPEQSDIRLADSAPVIVISDHSAAITLGAL